MSSVIQHTFAGGEIAPILYSRTDNNKYTSALKTSRNAIIGKSGAWMNRAGSLFVHEVIDSTKDYRIIPFVYSLEESYVLLFGDKNVQFILNGNPVLETGYANNVTSISASTAITVTVAAPFANGTQVFMSGVPGELGLLLNNRYFTTANATGTTMTLNYMDGTAVSYSPSLTLSMSASLLPVYTVTTPYNHYDLADLKFDQSGDTMTLCHPSYQPAQIQYLGTQVDGAGQWAYTLLNFIPSVLSNEITPTGTTNLPGGYNNQYRVTIQSLVTGEESYPCPVAGGSFVQAIPIPVSAQSHDGFSEASPGNTNATLYFSTPHGLTDGQVIQFSQNQIMTQYVYGVYPLVPTGQTLTLVTAGQNYTVASASTYSFSITQDNASPNPSTDHSTYSWGAPPPPFGNVNVLFSQSSATISSIVLGDGSTPSTYPVYITVTTSTNNHLNSGDQVLFYDTGVAQLDNRVFNVVVNPSTPTKAQIYIDASTYVGLPLGATGYMQATTIQIGSSAPLGTTPSTTNTVTTTSGSVASSVQTLVAGELVYNTLSWTYNLADPSGSAPSNVTYNIYRNVGGVFGYVGTTQAQTFIDNGLTIDTSQQPPSYDAVMNSLTNYPSVSAFYQQRHLFANSNKNPFTVWASKTGLFTNFSSETPVADDDAVIFELPSTKSEIMNVLDIGNLILFTESEERVVLGNNSGGQYGTLTPTAINEVVQSFWGSASLRPIAVNNSAIFLQARGNVIRDLTYFFEEDKYKGNDLTVFASHLFENYTIVDIDYQKIPYSILYAVRNDGALLTATINKEQQILAWSHYDTPGEYLNVCCIPEDTADSAYVLVKRNVVDENGLTASRVYVERFQIRTVAIENIQDNIFMDCAFTYNGFDNQYTFNLTLASGNTWTKNNLLNVCASGNPFTVNSVGSQVVFEDASGNIVRVTITNFVNANLVQGFSDCDIPTDLQGNTVTAGIAISQITGMWALNGCEVSVSADGYVISSTFNSDYDSIIVENGVINLPSPFTVINVGMAYKSDLMTLDVDVVGYTAIAGQTDVDKWKNISQVTPKLVNSLGGFYGDADPDTDEANSENDPLFKLNEVKDRDENTDPNLPPTLINGNIRMNIEGGWDINGNVFIRQVDPLPLCISAIAFAGNIPLRQGESQAQPMPGRINT